MSWCRYDAYYDEDFDGNFRGAGDLVSAARQAALEKGEADPTPAELELWRRAKCKEMADSGEVNVAWIVPLAPEQKIEGWALFTGHAGCAPEDEPNFEGIFDRPERALDFLRELGELGDIHWA